MTGQPFSEQDAASRPGTTPHDEFRRIADAAPVPMWVTALDRGRSFVNTAYVAFVGGDYSAAQARDWREIIHPDDVDRILAASIAGEATLDSFTLEGRFRRADGAWRVLQSTSQPRWDADGRHVGFIGVAHDVTERRAAEAALRHREESLRLAIEGAGMAAWELDIASGQGRWSPNRFDLLGLPRSETGEGAVEDWLARVHPDDTDAVEAAWRRCVSDGTPYTIAYRIRRADTGEERWLQSHGSRVDEDGRPSRFVGVSFDVTDTRRAQHRQQLLIDELNHRVKNTLAIVQGIAQQTFRSGVDADVARQAFEGRLRALSAAHDLLTMQHWGDVSLARVVAQAVAPHDGRGAITLRGPDLPIAPRTAVSLALAIHELATNATKYGALSVADGRVDVSWSREPGEGGERLALAWRERDGPPVTVPQRRGFGTRMIERGLSAELGGTVRIDFAPEGVCCTVDAPLAEAAA